MPSGAALDTYFDGWIDSTHFGGVRVARRTGPTSRDGLALLRNLGSTNECDLLRRARRNCRIRSSSVTAGKSECPNKGSLPSNHRIEISLNQMSSESSIEMLQPNARFRTTCSNLILARYQQVPYRVCARSGTGGREADPRKPRVASANVAVPTGERRYCWQSREWERHGGVPPPRRNSVQATASASSSFSSSCSCANTAQYCSSSTASCSSRITLISASCLIWHSMNNAGKNGGWWPSETELHDDAVAPLAIIPLWVRMQFIGALRNCLHHLAPSRLATPFGFLIVIRYMSRFCLGRE